MKSYKVEYLSVLNSKEDFCKSVESFNYLLQSYDHIDVVGNQVNFKENSYAYEVQFGEINEGNQRFFHLKLSCANSNILEDFKILLKSIRTILVKASGKPPEILWNDLSSQLSCEAYPILHEIENILRKLITKFMLTTVGGAWTKDTVPKEVADSLKDKKSIPTQNYLHETDFIQLSNFLFKEYSTANSKKLVEKLRKANDISELSIFDLKEMVPQSNWERYFSPVVDCTSEYLENRWEKLYELRCIVAHNRFINESEFEEIRRITEEIKIKLLSAIENLDKVHVSEDQKEEVAESIASNISKIYGEFIFEFNVLQEMMTHLHNLIYKENILENRQRVQFSKAVVRKLTTDGILPKEAYQHYRELNDIRNMIVHSLDSQFSEGALLDALTGMNVLKKDTLHAIEKLSSER